MSDKPIAEKPSSPITVNRKQTITIEASQKHSISKTNSEYETILSHPIEINNNDVIQISSVYCDTTGIDPTKIRIEKDVDITWENGLYLINQQIETVIPSGARNAPEDFITDNLPYTFCEYTVKGTSSYTHYTAARAQSTVVRTPRWGNIDFQIQYINTSGSQVRKICHIGEHTDPMWPAGAMNGSVEYSIDIIALTGSIQPIDPDTGLVSDDWGTLAPRGYVQVPIEADSLVGTAISNGVFQPVINKGTMTLRAGDYTPTYLAKLITDGLSFLNTSDLRNSIVRPTGKAILAGTSDQLTEMTTHPYWGIIAITDTLWPSMPFGWLNAINYVGWTVFIRWNEGDITTPQYVELERKIIGVGGVKYSLVVDDGWDVTFPTPAVPTRVHLIPPQNYYDKGSKFLQTTANYTATTITNEKAYAFVDCSKDVPDNILTFEHDLQMPIGTTQTELVWDEDLKRFKWNYLHFPIPATPTTGPALIIQPNLVRKGLDGHISYSNDYTDGAVNQITTSVGGVFFTSLQPQSLFETIMGFNYTDRSIQANVSQTTITTNSYTNGIVQGSRHPQEYTDVITPKIDLIYGQNITRQSASIADVVGGVDNYTTHAEIQVADPTNNNGRVLIERTQVQSIFAESNGNQIGVQDSGYFVVEIELGIQYNMSVGSSTKPKSFTRNIRAIINRYYSVNSYTSSGGSNTQYIHYGNSSVITSVKVRLRNSDGSVIKHIGNDNTVFLNILKNNQATIV